MPPSPHTDVAGAAPPSQIARRVRTRFAPSPTGFLHLGALRTALFSWLLARRFGGDFLLRIEDTDQNRLVPGSLNSIIESLHLMGMDYDEGPDKVSVAALGPVYGDVAPSLLPDHGGKYGPYFQSQRLPRYNEVLTQLLNEGKAYYAFETTEELEGARAAATARKEPYRYDRRYRDYPLADARERVGRGEPHVIRFKMPTEGLIITRDALRGVTEWDATTQDDFILLKGDGFPPYHLAAMVDDHDMEISHVLRGDDWLSSFPKHACIFQAMDWEPPVFVHTPNVLAPGGGKKLSKRHGAQSVQEFLDQGYLREALVNFLALVGWSPGDDSEVMPLNEIIERFDLEGISVSPAVFDVEKLNWMNGVYIRQLPPAELAERALAFLQKPYGENPDDKDEDGNPKPWPPLLPGEPNAEERAYASAAIVLEQEKMKRLDEAPGLIDFLFPLLPRYQEKSVDKWLRRNGQTTSAYLSDLAATLSDPPAWDAATMEGAVRSVGAAHGREKGDLVHPVRVAVSGREVGPGLFEMMAVMGRERVLARLGRAVEIAGA